MKKALSLLLAVLMLVSLFSGMAYADDDVIVEEPAAVDEIVGDDFVEAADAYVEEYTDEGSFEAADEISWTHYQATIPADWEVEFFVPENPTCGQLVEVHIRNGQDPTQESKSTTVRWDHVWEEDYVYNPEDPEAEEAGWETISVTEATCTKQGVIHQRRECVNCELVETRDIVLDRIGHVWGTDPLGADPDDPNHELPVTPKAILVAPTVTTEGVGHEVCIYCGGLNPDTEDYIIPEHDPDAEHDESIMGPWTEKVPARCSRDGYEERVCMVPGCTYSEDHIIDALGAHTHDFDDPDCAMEFKEIVRLDCAHYVEVWECTNPNCYTDADGATSVPSQFTAYVYNDDGDFETSLEDVNADDAFEYVVRDYEEPFNNNTEFYMHHRYTEDWQMEAARCCVAGLKWRVCAEGQNCPDIADSYMEFEIPALEPIYGDEVYLGYDEVNNHWYHYKSCTRDECVEEGEWIQAFLKPVFPLDQDYGRWFAPELEEPIIDPDDEDYYTQANNANKQALIVDHTWGEWNVEVPVTETQRGHLFRTCMVPGCGEREDFFGTQAEFDAKYNPPHPVLTTGIIKDEDGAFKLYKMGVFDEDFTGIYDGYNYVLEKSGKWYVVEGIWENDAMGATLVGETWYFLANGKVQEVTQLAEYQGKWFYVVNGVIDTSKNALVEYDTGLFVVAAGRIVDEYSGLWLNDKSIGGDGEWYYVANGQVQKDYTGITFYDGRWFYLENGKLIPDYTGEVEYDGEVFEFVSGNLVA